MPQIVAVCFKEHLQVDLFACKTALVFFTGTLKSCRIDSWSSGNQRWKPEGTMDRFIKESGFSFNAWMFSARTTNPVEPIDRAESGARLHAFWCTPPWQFPWKNTTARHSSHLTRDPKPWSGATAGGTEALFPSPQQWRFLKLCILYYITVYRYSFNVSKHLSKSFSHSSTRTKNRAQKWQGFLLGLPTTPWKVEACGPCRQGRLEFKMEKSCTVTSKFQTEICYQFRSRNNPTILCQSFQYECRESILSRFKYIDTYMII